MGLWNTHAERTGVALAGGAVLLVGGSVAASSLLAGYPVLGGQAIRYAAAGLLLAGWARLRHHQLPRPAGREWCWLAVLAAVGLAGSSVLLIMATRAASPAGVGVVIGAAPLIITIAGPVAVGRRPPRRVLAAAGIVTAGAAISCRHRHAACRCTQRAGRGNPRPHPTRRVSSRYHLSLMMRRCLDHGVPIVLSTPGADGLGEAVRVLREWQYDGAPVQLHPGDLGWHWRFGAEATAAAARTWSRDGQLLAVGLLDGPGLVRLAIAPEAQHDEELTAQMVADVSRPDRGVLPRGSVSVEARFGGLFQRLLLDDGWDPDEPWTPLRRDLAEPVADCGVQVEVIGPERAQVRVSVQRAAFSKSTFTEERWHAMAAGRPYADARCLVGYDDRGAAVAAATVWSAGSGRPGLLEPMGVHRDHRGHGYGAAITVAAAAVLRKMGSSSAIVCTKSSNVGAVATYRSAGFQQLPDVPDLLRRA